MFLIIGIGNKGSEFKNTRHNVGFIFVDQMVKEMSADSMGDKFDAEYFKAHCNDYRFDIVKPNTYVNLTGKTSSSWMGMHKQPVQHILTIYDDADMPLGTAKYRFAGTSGGHNGLRSIDAMSGKNYHKLRIGISSPKRQQEKLSKFVLGKFEDDELLTIESMGKSFAEFLMLLINGKMPSYLKGVQQFKMPAGDFSFDILKNGVNFWQKFWQKNYNS